MQVGIARKSWNNFYSFIERILIFIYKYNQFFVFLRWSSIFQSSLLATIVDYGSYMFNTMLAVLVVLFIGKQNQLKFVFYLQSAFLQKKKHFSLTNFNFKVLLIFLVQITLNFYKILKLSYKYQKVFVLVSFKLKMVIKTKHSLFTLLKKVF